MNDVCAIALGCALWLAVQGDKLRGLGGRIAWFINDHGRAK